MRDGEWSAWQDAASFDPGALYLEGGDIDAEVMDEAGNVGVTSMPLIRGLPDPARAGGCACEVTSADPRSHLGGLAAFVIALALVLRRRRASLAILPVIALALAVSGCECAAGGAPCARQSPPSHPGVFLLMFFTIVDLVDEYPSLTPPPRASRPPPACSSRSRVALFRLQCCK